MHRRLVLNCLCLLCAGVATKLFSCSSEEQAAGGPFVDVRDSQGTERRTFLTDLEEMQTTTGHGGWVTSIGAIEGPDQYEGVSLRALYDLVGGLSEGSGAQVIAADGYVTTLTSDQALAGAVKAFSPVSAEPLTTPPTISAILALRKNGQALAETEGGPFRLAFVSADTDQVTDGHLWVKNVVRLETEPLLSQWTLTLEGVRVEQMDRATFETGAAPGCHGATYEDERGRTWTGIELWLLVGRVDDQNVHENNAFNRDRANSGGGYTIEVRASSGAAVELESQRVAENSGILLANGLEESPLAEPDFPLKLVGADLEENEQLGAVEAIILRLEGR